MDALRTSEEYQKGVEEFIKFAKRNVPSKNGKYPCPCVKCVNVDRKSLDSIRNDLICEGIPIQEVDLAWGIGNYRGTCKSSGGG